MGNNVNFCGIVSISEESSIASAHINKNIMIRHYDEPTILSNPYIQPSFMEINETTTPYEYQILINKDTEIEGISGFENFATVSENNPNKFSKLFFSSETDKNELGLRKTIFSKDNSFE